MYSAPMLIYRKFISAHCWDNIKISFTFDSDQYSWNLLKYQFTGDSLFQRTRQQNQMNTVPCGVCFASQDFQGIYLPADGRTKKDRIISQRHDNVQIIPRVTELQCSCDFDSQRSPSSDWPLNRYVLPLIWYFPWQRTGQVNVNLVTINDHCVIE